MFVSRDNKSKKFQKPNILRRKPKPKPSIPRHVTPERTLVTATCVSESELGKSCSGTYVKTMQRQRQDSVCKDYTLCYDNEPDVISNLSGTSLLINNNEETAAQSIDHVELFLRDSDPVQSNTQFEIDSEIGCHIKHDWCLDFTSSSHEIIIENCIETDVKHDLDPISPASTMLLPVDFSPNDQELNSPETIVTPAQNLTIDYLASSTMNFKCDEPNCNKRFRSELKLNKHRSTHNTDSTVKTSRPTVIECPVKKADANGIEVRCGRTFPAKPELLKHLNEEHTLADAAHVCVECGRCFFWALGLRAHSRSHCARAGAGAALACAWPGCGRVFRQPCRLREHARAHTGDRPYPCRYPNCGWSFRTASKLLRHARRHTGERRHACAACGRAFLRREHLREHAARHARPPQDPQRCAHTGCERTFSNMGALLTHMKKVHRDRSAPAPAQPAPATHTGAPTLTHAQGDDTYMVSLESPSLSPPAVASEPVAAGAAGAAGAACERGEWRAARTHCTWPLAPRADDDTPEHADTGYVLEEDVQVEFSEGSESNIYTIRSDLFLHGNVLNNEDSQPIPCASVVLEAGEGADADAEADTGAPSHAIDAGLSLLDAHSNIDLMQEELMYTDAAVDESSFRVFLLSGEEIQIV